MFIEFVSRTVSNAAEFIAASLLLVIALVALLCGIAVVGCLWATGHSRHRENWIVDPIDPGIPDEENEDAYLQNREYRP